MTMSLKVQPRVKNIPIWPPSGCKIPANGLSMLLFVTLISIVAAQNVTGLSYGSATGI